MSCATGRSSQIPHPSLLVQWNNVVVEACAQLRFTLINGFQGLFKGWPVFFGRDGFGYKNDKYKSVDAPQIQSSAICRIEHDVIAVVVDVCHWESQRSTKDRRGANKM